MRKLLRTAALAATAALGIAASIPAAQAEGVYFGFGNADARFGIAAAEGVQWRHGERDGWRGRHGWNRRDDWRRGPPRCSPDRALRKAERLGLRRVRLNDVGRDTIRISGFRNGGRYAVVFARAPFCPVIRF